MSLINDALKQASQAQRSQRAPRIPDEILKPADGPTPPPRSFFSKFVAPFLRAVVALGLIGGGGLLYYKWSENRLHESEGENVAAGKKSSRHKQSGKQAGKAAVIGGSGKTNSTDTTKQVEPKATTNSQVLVMANTKTNEATTAVVANPATNTAVVINVGPTNDLVVVIPPTPTNGASVVAQPVTNSPPVFPPSPPVFPGGTNMSATKMGGTNMAGTNAVAIQQPFPRLRITAIGYRPVNPWALINNRNVNLGDVIDDARIIRIERSSVVVEFDGRTNEFWMLR